MSRLKPTDILGEIFDPVNHVLRENVRMSELREFILGVKEVSNADQQKEKEDSVKRNRELAEIKAASEKKAAEDKAAAEKKAADKKIADEQSALAKAEADKREKDAKKKNEK